MKSWFGGLMFALTLSTAQAFEVSDWTYVNGLKWEEIGKISSVETYKVGGSEILYFSHVSQGKEVANKIDSTKNPILHALILTAYISGAPIQIKTGVVDKEGRKVLAARLKN